MEARRLYWLGDRHKAALETRLKEALSRWNSTWWADGFSPYKDALITVSPAEHYLERDALWSPMSAGQQVLAWVRTSGGTAAWMGAVIGQPAAPTANKAWDRLSRRVLEDLLANLSLQSTEAVSLLSDVMLPEALFTKASGAALITVKGASELSILLPLSTVEQIADMPALPPRPRIVRSDKNFDSAVVPVEVLLDVSGGLTVEQLRSLSVGDVVLLDQALGAEWTMVNRSGASIGRCRPGRSGQKFAVQLLPASKNS